MKAEPIGIYLGFNIFYSKLLEKKAKKKSSRVQSDALLRRYLIDGSLGSVLVNDVCD